jgi:hypothetical protein
VPDLPEDDRCKTIVREIDALIEEYCQRREWDSYAGTEQLTVTNWLIMGEQRSFEEDPHTGSFRIASESGGNWVTMIGMVRACQVRLEHEWATRDSDE